MAYRAALNEIRFILDQVVPVAPVAATARFAEATPETVAAILTEAARLCDTVIAPVQRAGDLHPARLENGVVRASPGFAEAYRAIAEGGWIGLSAAPEHGGMGLPQVLNMAVGDMMAGACLALQLNPLLTQGQIDALEHHASDEIRALFLPKLVSGAWAGTMNLTEPQAGSDVGALAARAEPRGDGTYAISGQKIFISWGDSDLTENVCHLVLARLPDAAPGTRGISLFLVPKFLPEADGRLGAQNALKVLSLEHKMGLHGSPTCVMSYEGATGWLVGAPHRGMAAMFTMMNNARLAVGVQGIGVAEAALQQAARFAAERRQMGPIIDHADVRRMLAEMRAEVFAARALALSCAVSLDLARATSGPEATEHAARAALLTPIAKAFGTEVGCRVADTGIQIHGGMGFVEETGAAQFLRDVRVTAIYEGTNGIQAMDLVGRKLADGGEAAMRLIQEIEDAALAARGRLPDLAEPVWTAAEALRDTTEALLEMPPAERLAGATSYLAAFARVLGADSHLKAALAAGAEGWRVTLARIYIQRLLPEATPALGRAVMPPADLFALTPEALSA